LLTSVRTLRTEDLKVNKLHWTPSLFCTLPKGSRGHDSAAVILGLFFRVYVILQTHMYPSIEWQNLPITCNPFQLTLKYVPQCK